MVSAILFLVVEGCTFRCSDGSPPVQQASNAGPRGLLGSDRNRRRKPDISGVPLSGTLLMVY